MAFPLANPPSRLSPKLLTRATTAPLASPSPNYDPRIKEFPPNALRRKIDRLWRGGFSLGVDLGLSRTGVALSKGFSVRPLTVLELRGQKLELRLLEIAEDEEADEFIIGVPRSSDGRETTQSNKVHSVAGRLAVRAAERIRYCHGLLYRREADVHFRGCAVMVLRMQERSSVLCFSCAWGWRVYLQDEHGTSTDATHRA
ncbi:uncharacterized protein LOC116197915 isoform X3 [Punica granatum]|uniref:Uncharacterized protein LOC116197915 isoform X3 n=1 Tax=Punica granatum TaxID=22663 RepID=A0A6P8CRU8_PUNGR|nr:uncharacterized protein LOC116197915 isoform X3 [Punica granatum]